MSESRFINKATTEYLKSKAGATVQQQIQNIKERIDLEANDLSILSKNQILHREEIAGEIANLRNYYFEEINDRMTALVGLEDKLEKVKQQFFYRIRQLVLAIAVLGGISLCLIIKSLI